MQIRVPLIATLGFLLSSAAFALSYDQVETAPKPEEIRASDESLKEAFRSHQINLTPTWYRYTEPNVMHFKGLNYRIGAEHTFFLSDYSRWLMHIDYSVAFGEMDYSSFKTGTSENSKNYIYELKINTGKVTHFSGDPFMYYFGLAYRRLDSDSRGQSSTGHFGYRRKSQYLTLTVGTEWIIPLNESWDFHLKNELGVLAIGKQTSHLGDVGTGRSTIENDQGLGINLRLNPHFVLSKHFVMGPYIDLWYVGDSDSVYDSGTGMYFYEPENNTVELGISLGARF